RSYPAWLATTVPPAAQAVCPSVQVETRPRDARVALVAEEAAGVVAAPAANALTANATTPNPVSPTTDPTYRCIRSLLPRRHNARRPVAPNEVAPLPPKPLARFGSNDEAGSR